MLKRIKLPQSIPQSKRVQNMVTRLKPIQQLGYPQMLECWELRDTNPAQAEQCFYDNLRWWIDVTFLKKAQCQFNPITFQKDPTGSTFHTDPNQVFQFSNTRMVGSIDLSQANCSNINTPTISCQGITDAQRVLMCQNACLNVKHPDYPQMWMKMEATGCETIGSNYGRAWCWCNKDPESPV